MDFYKKYSEKIKAEAKRLGFFACGISKARFLEEEAQNLENWLKKEQHAEMKYMENYFDKRLDPRKLVDGAKSVISVLYPYFPHVLQKDPQAPVISKYAYGKDYHYVVKDKLRQLYDYINNEITETAGRYFTDSAPVLEKKWAELSGLGWRGKNSNLLTRNGSFFFIGELIIDLELEYDTPINELCGNCTRCIDACPTDAITEPYVIDANRCISYLTIELKGKIPDEMKGKFKNRVFGCDICQDICSHNRKPIFHNNDNFIPHTDLIEMSEAEWHSISTDLFNEIFKKSAVKRTKYKGFKRNLEFLKSLA